MPVSTFTNLLPVDKPEPPRMMFLGIQYIRNCDPEFEFLVEGRDRINVEFKVENPNSTFKLAETIGMAIRVYTEDRTDDFLVCLPDYLDCLPEYNPERRCNCKSLSDPATGYIGYTVQATWNVLEPYSEGMFEAAWEIPGNPFTRAKGSVIKLTNKAMRLPEIRRGLGYCLESPTIWPAQRATIFKMCPSKAIEIQPKSRATLYIILGVMITTGWTILFVTVYVINKLKAQQALQATDPQDDDLRQSAARRSPSSRSESQGSLSLKSLDQKSLNVEGDGNRSLRSMRSGGERRGSVVSGRGGSVGSGRGGRTVPGSEI